MTDGVISFFNCAPVSRENQISVTAPCVVEKTFFTVKGTAKTAYIYMARAARRFKRWITVTSSAVRRLFARTGRSSQPCRMRPTGVQILRNIAILRI